MAVSEEVPDVATDERPFPRGAAAVLTGVVGALCVVLLAGWVPHYLSWPWWTDLDAYSVMAMAWDEGILPYRDFAAFNFPGQIYVFWALGKLVGWGHPWAFYAVDAALLIAFGLLLALWGRLAMSRTLAGLIAFAAVLHLYLGLDYTLVGQRDWQGPLLTFAGLLAVQAWPDGRGRFVSGLLIGASVAIRPHVVLFLPAFVLALDAAARPAGEPWSRTVRATALWGLALIVGLGLAFAPLIDAGVGLDFLREIRRGGYGRRGAMTTLGNVVRGVRDGLLVPSNAALIVAFVAALLARSIPIDLRRRALPWLAVLALAVPYRPLHPVPHDYLDLPLGLAWCAAAGTLAALLMAAIAWPVWIRVAGVLAVLAVAVPGPPEFFAPRRSLDDTQRWLRGEPIVDVPLGYQPRASIKTAAHYPWDDYRALLDYLREGTTSGENVANALRWFTSVNGPIGRPSPFHGESGLVWAWAVDSEAEARYADELARRPHSVVVWIPDEDGPAPLDLPHLEDVIRRDYEPSTRFGAIEVWRRKPTGPSFGRRARP